MLISRDLADGFMKSTWPWRERIASRALGADGTQPRPLYESKKRRWVSDTKDMLLELLLYDTEVVLDRIQSSRTPGIS